MLEVTFSESAGGSLRLAQTFGKGKRMGASSVIFFSDDGSQPDAAELERAQKEAEEQRAQREWEAAVPLGGSARNVFCFPLALSLGDVREPFGEARRAFLQSMICMSGSELDNVAAEQLQAAEEALHTLLERAGRGEAVRIWYSHNPDELCGLHWLMTQLREATDIRAVELPANEERPNGTLLQYNGWGDIGPGEWHRFTALEKPVSPISRRVMAAHWCQLAEENAPIRAVLNGRLQSCGVDLYDYYIDRELDAAGEEFREAIVIGNVLGKYQLGISDWLVHDRIEKRVAQGRLVPITAPEEGCPVYHRILRKV